MAPLNDVPDSLFRAAIWPAIIAIIGVALVTAPLLVIDRKLAANLVPVAYLIPVIVAATRSGIWAATVASTASMIAADFFFFPPLYTFQIDDPQNVVHLLLFLVVALVSSNLASRLKRETDALRHRERDIQKLYELSQHLAACFTIAELVSAIQDYLSRNLGPRAGFFVATPEGHFEPQRTLQAPPAVRESVASMALQVGAPDRTIVDTGTQETWLLRAVSSRSAAHCVIAINIGSGSSKAIRAKRRDVEAILDEVSLTLQRLDIGKAMEDARLHLQAELLRDAFHGTLSHELCSPLAAIQGSASVLTSIPAIQADAQASPLVAAISEEVAQLDGYIKNLLHATRVSAGGLKPRPEWSDPRDIVNAAIERSARRLNDYEVVTEFDEDLPLLNVDSGLIEEACAQLLQNAAKYSPSGSRISIRLYADSTRVGLSVSDQGVGMTPDELQELGRRSFRGGRHQATVPGSGLGFWIASTFVRANGGTITVSSRGQGMGTTVSMSLPRIPVIHSEPTAPDNE